MYKLYIHFYRNCAFSCRFSFLQLQRANECFTWHNLRGKTKVLCKFRKSCKEKSCILLYKVSYYKTDTHQVFIIQDYPFKMSFSSRKWGIENTSLLSSWQQNKLLSSLTWWKKNISMNLSVIEGTSTESFFPLKANGQNFLLPLHILQQSILTINQTYLLRVAFPVFKPQQGNSDCYPHYLVLFQSQSSVMVNTM